MSEHGTTAHYRAGCRCSACRAANNARHAKLKGRTPPKHGTASAYQNYGCRCDACKTAGREMNRQSREHIRAGKWNLSHGTAACVWSGCRCDVCASARIELTRSANARFKTANTDSRRTATRHRYQWTGPEIELAARPDLTLAEVATMTGRTIAAVHGMRTRINRGDPKVVMFL